MLVVVVAGVEPVGVAVTSVRNSAIPWYETDVPSVPLCVPIGQSPKKLYRTS